MATTDVKYLGLDLKSPIVSTKLRKWKAAVPEPWS